MLSGNATISVVIPALDEAGSVARAVASARDQGANEIIVADGGSRDGTPRAARQAGARVVAVDPPQRARQMNAGARAAGGDVLVFQHADSTFIPGALDALRVALRDPRIVGGGFVRRYRTRSRFLAMSSSIGNLRGRWLGWIYGDQANWARRDAFDQVGGFPEEPIFEDLDFSRSLRCVGCTVMIEPGIETSARRFRNGAAPRVLGDAWLTVRHVWFG